MSAKSLVKIDSNLMAEIGATGTEDFNASLTTFIAEAKTNAKFMADSKVTLETLAASIAALEGKILTEAKVKELAGGLSKADVTAAIAEWAGSEAGKKIIGSESSRIAMEALAGVGTIPAKPAPITAGGDTPEAKSKALITQGKFEEAYAADPQLQSEFPSAKHFAAYARNAGAVKITSRK